MIASITGCAGALITVIAVLAGAAILRAGAAAADPNQDEQFLAFLEQAEIPAINGIPSLIDSAHWICRKLDGGMRADALVDEMVNNAYGIDPSERLYAPGRLARTEARFIIASVKAYCPQNQRKLASLTINPAGWNEPMGGTVAFNAPVLRLASLIRAVPTGEIDPPNPPMIPPPAPPTAHIQTPQRPIAVPPRPKQPPPPPQQSAPPPQQPPPPPQQVGPPGVGPQQGGSGGGGTGGGTGGGGTGGGRPTEPPPPMPPGFVRLAP